MFLNRFVAYDCVQPYVGLFVERALAFRHCANAAERALGIRGGRGGSLRGIMP